MLKFEQDEQESLRVEEKEGLVEDTRQEAKEYVHVYEQLKVEEGVRLAFRANWS